jgi:methionyl-tRNA synthetase
MPKFYLTTPIYYVNARPHIGHAYTTIVADVIARRHRLLGDDTYFLTGTDEHGQKIERAAFAAGVPPQQFANEVSAAFEGLWQRMGITNRQFIRTTDRAHKRGVQKLFADLYERGFIELRTYTGQYCVSEETFVEGPPGTLGPDGKPTETVSEENFFFKLSEFQLPLIDLIESNTFVIQPESRRNEVLSFLRGGLKDLSISRSSFTWGVPVPEPAASEAKEKHVIYVWLDALANYMTAVGYGSEDTVDIEKFERYWPADLHLVGKEIIRFHCVYWPAFLMALRPPEVPPAEWNKKWLPKAIVAHGWLLFEESKMSKSRGNIVRTETILDAFGPLCPPQPPSPPLLSSRRAAEGPASPEAPLPPTKAQQDLFAADILRYFLLREIPFGQDGSFSFDALITRYNADLANGYGNLVSRTLSMIDRYRAGFHPAPPSGDIAGLYDASLLPGELAYMLGARSRLAEIGVEEEDRLRLQNWIGVPPTPPAVAHAEQALDQFDFARALDRITAIIGGVDAFITSTAPWSLAKHEDRRDQLSGILYIAAESIRIITAFLHPILPYATASVWRQLGLGDIEEAARKGELKNLQWGGLKPGTKLGRLSPIFPRADKGLAQIMTDMESENEKPKAPEPVQPILSDEFDDITPIPTDPAAGPRTASLPEENPGAKVAGSHALTTERTGTPPHSEAQASGVFAAASPPATANLQPATISIDDFAKVDLRVAQIVVAERIPKADKLLRLEVDLGPNFPRRQILAGIAEYYTPESLIGRKVVIVANLAPRKMRGLESNGMIVAASLGAEGRPVLAGFLEDVELGARLK